MKVSFMHVNCFHIVVLYIIFFIQACKSPESNLLHFDPRILEEKELRLSEIADEVAYIQMDNRIPLGMIYDKIDFINNNFYLSEKSLGILAFDKGGMVLRKIGGKGRGPEEYVNNYLFTIDKKSETVYVYDIGHIIKVFSKSGNLLRSFSLKDYGSAENISSYNSDLFVLFTSQFSKSPYEWIVFDTLGNIVKKRGRRLPKFTTNWSASAPLYMHKNQLSYYNCFSDTVFSISPDLEEKPSLIISPGEHRLPRSNLTPIQMMSKKYLFINKIFETDRFFIFQYSFKKAYLALIDKKSHESFLVDLKYTENNYNNGITNDLDGGQFFIPDNYFTENGREYLIELLYPYQIKASVKTEEFRNSLPQYPTKKKVLEELANSLKETDNPVLMVVRLKE